MKGKVTNMFGRTSNQSGNGINVNTSFKTFFSDLSSLSVGAWNGQMSIRITPSMGTDSNGIRQYDNNRKANTALYPEKALLLKEAFDKHIRPLVKAYKETGEGQSKSVSLSLGSNEKKNVLSIEFKEGSDGKYHLYLTINQMIREDNSVDPQNVFSYCFNENTYVLDYNPSNGTYASEESCESEFEVFYEMLGNVVNILPIAAHGVKYTNTVSARFSGNKNGNDYQNQQSSYSSAPSFNDIPQTYNGSEVTDLGLPFN